ncbi:fimbrial protein, partial [Salmonella enterica subsp. enterica serovar Newport str. S09097]
MAKRQALLHGAACILCGALILPVSAADNLHFFPGSLVASPCTLTMQGT